jgi:aryl-alcohol dehydrogenase-like predicted oxidoreductase
MKRREFIKRLAATTSTLIVGGINPLVASDRLGSILPQRKLGKTGEKVTMLGVGGYHVGWTTERDAQETIEAALEGGVRFFDTSQSYGDGESEIRYGKYLIPKHRDLVFLMTKSNASDAKTVQKHLDESLKRLKTDYLDLWQIHSIRDPADVDTRLENDVLEVFLKAKQEGKTRYIGFTGHRNPAAHERMLEQVKDPDVFDTCQMPVNVLDPSSHSFIRRVMQSLLDRNIGLLAMKTLADGRFFAQKKRLDRIQWETDQPVVPGRVSLQEALNFVWSLPVRVLITGAENAQLMKEKIRLTNEFVSMQQTDRDELINRVADMAVEGKVEYYKQVG